MKTPKACLTCNMITYNGTRCKDCTKRKDSLYDNAYRKRAKTVRDNAIKCWICGGMARSEDPWTADHLIPSDKHSVLMAAHRSCNSRRGNKT